MANKLVPADVARSSRRFLRSYMVLIWIFLAVALVGWLLLYRSLDKYETSLPSSKAEKIVLEMQGGDISSLLIDDPYQSGALSYCMASLTDRPFSAQHTGTDKDDRTYAVSCDGVALAEFTLREADGGWKVESARVSDDCLKAYSDASSLRQAELLLDRIAANDYSQIWPNLSLTGFYGEDIGSFTSFMAANTPSRESLSVRRRDENGERIYTILAGDSLFGTCTMRQDGNSDWQIVSVRLNEALRESYVQYLADLSAQKILSSFTEENYGPLYALCTANGYPEGGEEDFASLLSSLPGRESARCSLYEAEGSDRKYLILYGDTEVADFTLTRSEERYWAVTSFTMSVWTPFEATITAPAESVVSVDGRALTSSDEVSREVPKRTDSYVLSIAPDKVTLVTYYVRSPFPPQSITAVDPDGREQELIRESDSSYRFELNTCDGEMARGMRDLLLSFAKAWGYFSLHDTDLADIAQYVERDSTAYIYICNSENSIVREHYREKIHFMNFAARNFIRYDEDTISCEITYDMSVAYVDQTVTQIYHPAYRLYLRRTDGEWKVYYFTGLDAGRTA